MFITKLAHYTVCVTPVGSGRCCSRFRIRRPALPNSLLAQPRARIERFVLCRLQPVATRSRFRIRRPAMLNSLLAQNLRIERFVYCRLASGLLPQVVLTRAVPLHSGHCPDHPPATAGGTDKSCNAGVSDKSWLTHFNFNSRRSAAMSGLMMFSGESF